MAATRTARLPPPPEPRRSLRDGRHVIDKAIVVGAVRVRGKASGRVRLTVVSDVSDRSLTGFVKANVAPGALVLTDGWQGYEPLSRMGYRPRARTQGDARRAAKLLPRIHAAYLVRNPLSLKRLV